MENRETNEKGRAEAEFEVTVSSPCEAVASNLRNRPRALVQFRHTDGQHDFGPDHKEEAEINLLPHSHDCGGLQAMGLAVTSRSPHG